jgi:hypothetical protein
VSVVVVTTISCDAAILRCASCQVESATSSAVTGVACQLCDGTMLFDRRCETGLSLHRDAILIRCIAENKEGWCCEDRGGRDFCTVHAHLANSSIGGRAMSNVQSVKT